MHRRISEYVVESLIKLSGLLVIILVFLLFLFLLKDSLSLFGVYPLGKFLFGRSWLPISEPPRFGVVPLFLGSIAHKFVTFYLTEKGQEVVEDKGFVPVTDY